MSTVVTVCPQSSTSDTVGEGRPRDVLCLSCGGLGRPKDVHARLRTSESRGD